MLTGTHLLSYQGLGKLSPERPRVARTLQSHGLSTGGFQSNPFLSEQFEYHVGFETYRDYQNPLMGVATKVFPRGIEINNPRLKTIDDALGLTDKLKRAYQLVSGKARPYVGADVITDDTLEWLDNTESPFFCWTHYMDVHHPCFPPAEYRERYDVKDVTVGQVSDWYSALINDPERLTDEEMDALLALYDAAIEYVDDQINRLVEELKRTDRYEETLIIVTSDHGEMFGEHGEYGKPPQMFDELLRVPLIVANGPDYLDAASDELVSLIDIPPLIHDTLGLDIPPEYEGQLPGRSEPRTYIVGEHELDGQPVVGARSEDLLYEYDASQDTERVYEVRDGTAVPTTDRDPTPELQEVVSARLDQFEEGTTYDLEADVDGDIEARLEDLGYL
jgi:arylsulfatase A-like enzyme